MNHNENKEIERFQDPEEKFLHNWLCPHAYNKNTKSKCICRKLKHNGRETPGGDSAIDRGCTCPVLDNNYGLGDGGGNFWYNQNCPVHVKK